jgi:hypothetical protein
VSLRYGQRATVNGLLRTVDGEPIADAQINVTRHPAGWPARSSGTVHTNQQGRFSYQVGAGPSRRLTFSFAGDGTLRGASAASRVLVSGRATINAAATAVAGRGLRLFGRLLGGYIPAGGALIQLQYHIVGFAGGWAPFDVVVRGQPYNVLVRVHPDGRWSTVVPLTPTAAGYTYLIRGVAQGQNGWPYTGALTSVISRHVQAAKAPAAARDRREVRAAAARRNARVAAARRHARRVAQRRAHRGRGPAPRRRSVRAPRATRRHAIRMLSIRWLLDPAHDPLIEI